MIRQALISSIGRSAESLGYHFYAPNACSPRAAVSQLPAATIAPLRITSTEGRKEPHVTYRVALTLLAPSDFAAGDREALWSVMERDALTIYRAMEDVAVVCSIGGFSATPSSKPLTRFGDCSLTAEFDVEAIFCFE
ncbi:MAG: hypothetical protein IKM50_00325 [Tidjanibacter sp.]|nr:hypothetical protein [Tidjanibacter sp.]MBR6812971.1 hypothetical protein [Tidjanibacter sp.]